MSDRDARLLPRMMAALDTLDNDAEIANSVRQIRRLVGPGFFTRVLPDGVPLFTDDVSLAHSDREIAIRLRGLGLSLRLTRHPHQDIAAALHRTATAMIAGSQVARGDLLLTVACLRDDIIQREQEERRAGLRFVMGGSMRADLHASLDLLFSLMMRGR